MRINSFINKVKQTPKSLKALVLVLLAIAFPAFSMVQAANTVVMEGNTTVMNVTAGQTTYSDSVDAKVDEVVQVQVWQHNREMPDTNKAANTRVKVNIPTTPGKTQVITGTTTADGANTITDTATVNLSLDSAHLDFEEGTAKFRYNKGAADGNAACITGVNFPPATCYATVSVPDDVVTGGADGKGLNLDAYRKGALTPNGGPLNGCNSYHETITVQARSKADVVTVNKYVRHLGEDANAWKTSTTAKPGDKLEYLIRFQNHGNTVLNNVMVGDNMPKYNSYVNGTTMLSNGSNPAGLKITNDNITKGGIDVGNYNPGAAGYVWFTAAIDPISAYAKCGTYDVRNVGVVRPAGMDNYYNTAQVNIQVDCKENPKPTYSCDLLKAVQSNNRKATYTASASAKNGATIKNYVYNFGDGQTLTTDKSTVDHTYAKDGQYIASVTVNIANGNQTIPTTSDACKVEVGYTSTPGNPGTPVKPVSTPTSLPNTGAGSTAAIFAAVTAFSTGAYYLVARRLARF